MPVKLINLLLLILFFVTISCKKKIIEPEPLEKPMAPAERVDVELLKDSIYYYYKLYSLWETSVTKYDEISSFTDEFKTPNEVLTRLKSMTPVFEAYSSYGGRYDRFSYFSEVDDLDANSSKLQMDRNEGAGLSFSMGAINDSTAYPVVYMVEGGSSASKAGLRRGDIVLALDDEDMKVKVNCSSSSCNVVDRSKLDRVNLAISRVNSANKVSVKVQNHSNEVKLYTLINNKYDIDPLMVDTVFKFSNMNVGYFAYSSFEEINNNNLNQQRIDVMFERFERESIKSLIVDLRYNGGGYVDAATYIADKIINTAGKNNLMLKYEVNSYLEQSKKSSNSTFKDVNFKKTSNLELALVCFIVSRSTASASEMLINVLKPYMNVKLIAEEQYTYGKPVGYFPQQILGKIDLWVASFKLLNAKGQADYWTGMLGDMTNVTDYIFLDFGVKDEDMIAAALGLTGANQNQSRLRMAETPHRVGFRKMEKINDVVIKGALKTR